MKALPTKCIWLLVALLGIAVGGYFLRLSAGRLAAGETIEIRDFEAVEAPPETNTYSGALARARWRLDCPGQVRIIEECKRPPMAGENRLSWLQNALTHLEYTFPNGCFATTTDMGHWRVAHYRSVLDKIQNEFNLRMVSSHPIADIAYPGPEFQKTFEFVSRIKFQHVRSYDDPNLSTEVDDWEDVRQFFEVLDFLPYVKGSTVRVDRYGCLDEIIRCHMYDDEYEIGEIAIHTHTHLGIRIGWDHLKADLQLTPKSSDALESYLNKHAYHGAQLYWPDDLELNSPVLKVRTPPAIGARNHIDIDKEQAGADPPATMPADKPPVKDQPSTPTPKDGPR